MGKKYFKKLFEIKKRIIESNFLESIEENVIFYKCMIIRCLVVRVRFFVSVKVCEKMWIVVSIGNLEIIFIIVLIRFVFDWVIKLCILYI